MGAGTGRDVKQSRRMAAAAASPEERVTAFIANYFRAHSRSRGLTVDTDADSKRWADAVDKLDAAHFVDHGGQRSRA